MPPTFFPIAANAQFGDVPQHRIGPYQFDTSLFVVAIDRGALVVRVFTSADLGATWTPIGGDGPPVQDAHEGADIGFLDLGETRWTLPRSVAVTVFNDHLYCATIHTDGHLRITAFDMATGVWATSSKAGPNLNYSDEQLGRSKHVPIFNPLGSRRFFIERTGLNAYIVIWDDLTVLDTPDYAGNPRTAYGRVRSATCDGSDWGTPALVSPATDVLREGSTVECTAQADSGITLAFVQHNTDTRILAHDNSRDLTAWQIVSGFTTSGQALATNTPSATMAASKTSDDKPGQADVVLPALQPVSSVYCGAAGTLATTTVDLFNTGAGGYGAFVAQSRFYLLGNDPIFDSHVRTYIGQVCGTWIVGDSIELPADAFQWATGNGLLSGYGIVIGSPQTGGTVPDVFDGPLRYVPSAIKHPGQDIIGAAGIPSAEAFGNGSGIRGGSPDSCAPVPGGIPPPQAGCGVGDSTPPDTSAQCGLYQAF